MVEVTQEDRIRAVAIMADRWHSANKATVLAGDADGWIPVQECARHRTEATATLTAERDAALEQVRVLREASVTAVVPLEALLLSGSVSLHSPDLRQAVVDGAQAVRAALASTGQQG